MTSSENTTSSHNPTSSATEIKDDWQIVTGEDGQLSEHFEKPKTPGTEREEDASKLPTEKSAVDDKSDVKDAKWAAIQPQRGGAYPDREAKAPSYPSFTGNW
ncbi:hypothetical protein FGRMN_6663 [Fusarium graminum]|nr:hypothetical protein FGRMN_6663 [Fusarium graminum]